MLFVFNMGNKISKKLNERRLSSRKKEQQRPASVNNSTQQQVSASKPTISKKQISDEKLQRLFDQYADSQELIGPEGVMKFCEDLEVDPEHVS